MPSIRTPLPLLLSSLLLVACSPSDAGGASAASRGDEPSATGGLEFLPPEPGEGPIGPVDGFASDVVARPYYHDFGHVKEGKTVSHVFRMRNTSDVPINVTKITAGCGCTVPRVRYVAEDGTIVNGLVSRTGNAPVLTIPPGVVAEFEVAIDSKLVQVKNSDKTTTVTVATDSPGSHYFQLETHIYVVRAFNQVPTGISFGRVPRNGGGRGSTQLVQASGQTDEIVEVIAKPEGVVVELVHEEPRVWRLEAELLAPLEPGVFTGDVVLSTRTILGEPSDPLVVGLRADVVEDVTVSPARLVFAARDVASRGSVEVSTLLPGHRLLATGLEFVEPEHAEFLDARFEAVEPDGRGTSPTWLVEVRSSDPTRVTEQVRGELRVLLDDPQHPEVRVIYIIHPAS